MRVLGVDPGLLHTGWAVLDDGKPIALGTLIPPKKVELTSHFVLSFVVPQLLAVAREHLPEVVAVEQVTWYGKAKRITLPLSHVAGGIIGALLTLEIPVYVYLPGMKPKVRARKAWDEHQKDAVALALAATQHEAALIAGDTSFLRKHLAASKRRITIARSAPTPPIVEG